MGWTLLGKIFFRRITSIIHQACSQQVFLTPVQLKRKLRELVALRLINNYYNSIDDIDSRIEFFATRECICAGREITPFII